MSGDTWQLGQFGARNHQLGYKNGNQEFAQRNMPVAHLLYRIARKLAYLVGIDKPLRIFPNKRSKFNWQRNSHLAGEFAQFII